MSEIFQFFVPRVVNRKQRNENGMCDVKLGTKIKVAKTAVFCASPKSKVAKEVAVAIASCFSWHNNIPTGTKPATQLLALFYV